MTVSIRRRFSHDVIHLSRVSRRGGCADIQVQRWRLAFEPKAGARHGRRTRGDRTGTVRAGDNVTGDKCAQVDLVGMERRLQDIVAALPRLDDRLTSVEIDIEVEALAIADNESAALDLARRNLIPVLPSLVSFIGTSLPPPRSMQL